MCPQRSVPLGMNFGCHFCAIALLKFVAPCEYCRDRVAFYLRLAGVNAPAYLNVRLDSHQDCLLARYGQVGEKVLADRVS